MTNQQPPTINSLILKLKFLCFGTKQDPMSLEQIERAKYRVQKKVDLLEEVAQALSYVGLPEEASSTRSMAHDCNATFNAAFESDDFSAMKKVEETLDYVLENLRVVMADMSSNNQKT